MRRSREGPVRMPTLERQSQDAQCGRCSGLVVAETYEDFRGRRCILCGERVDPAILAQRRRLVPDQKPAGLVEPVIRLSTGLLTVCASPELPTAESVVSACFGFAHVPPTQNGSNVVPTHSTKSESIGFQGWCVLSRCSITRHEEPKGWNSPRSAPVGSLHSSAK